MNKFILILITCFAALQADEPRRVIVTGGPGAGKTTILLCMEQLGFDIVNEAASDIIKIDLAHQVKTPWNLEHFQKRVLELQKVRQEKALKSDKPIVFFDRSPFDTMTYQEMKWPDADSGYLTNSLSELKEKHYYHNTVFIVENFGECLNNEVRHESTKEALEIQNRIEAGYRKHGFRVVRVPPDHPEKRVLTILNALCFEDSAPDADLLISRP